MARLVDIVEDAQVTIVFKRNATTFGEKLVHRGARMVAHGCYKP